MKRIYLFFATIGLLASCNTGGGVDDTSLPFEVRAQLLLEKMTIEEKISQLTYDSPAIERLGIPEYNWWNECLHGVGRAGIATVFPQAIGLASMWDTVQISEVGVAISDEARAKHSHFLEKGDRGIYKGLTFWTPNINIFRDPRWGRGQETYGEDPFLTSRYAVNFIRALQGDDQKYLKLVATAKHFVVHSGPESTRHSFDAKPSEYDFLETYSPQFKASVEQAGVYSIMCAYNSYNGKPCCGNEYLSHLLRNQWGFEGYIVSDCWALHDFYETGAHEVVNTKAEAAAMAIKAGTDLNCGDTYRSMNEALDKGLVTIDIIDTAVKRLLLARFKLGMFDDPSDVPYNSIPYSVVDSPKHKQLALQTARKSIVLLKNSNSLLPLSKNIKRVAVIGPNADDAEMQLGNYNGFASNVTTVLQAVREKLPNSEVDYQPGCHIVDGAPILTPIPQEVLFVDENLSQNGLAVSYYQTENFSGNAIESVEKNVDFIWPEQSPKNGIGAEHFSVVYKGYLVPKVTGNHVIGVWGFPWASVKVDTLELLQNKPKDDEPYKNHGQIYLQAGKKYAVEVKFYQNTNPYAGVKLLWEQPDNQMHERALNLAKNSDVVILCLGSNPTVEGEEGAVGGGSFKKDDRESVDLPFVQKKLIADIAKTKKPIVLVLMNGGAIALTDENKLADAIVEAWYPGQAGGQAVCDVLFGDYNPAGRLPVTIYKSTNQLPDFEDYSMNGRTYRYFDGEPLYQFGYGLSFSSFKYSNMKVQRAGNGLMVSVNVSNSSDLDGDEVAQLYISHPGSKFYTAIRSLKGFTRTFIKAGETKQLTFIVNKQDLQLIDHNNNYVDSDVNLLISVGGGQPSEQSLKNGQCVETIVDLKKL